jgi:hypothetical protein
MTLDQIRNHIINRYKEINKEKIRLEKQFCCDDIVFDGSAQQIHMWHLESLFQECFGQHLFFESGIWKKTNDAK